MSSNLETNCMRAVFFETCDTFDKQYTSLKNIWSNLDPKVQLHCFQFLLGNPGLNHDLLTEDCTQRISLRILALGYLIRDEKKVYIHSDNDLTKISIFNDTFDYHFQWSACGLVACYPENDELKIISDFAEALDEIDLMRIHKNEWNAAKNAGTAMEN